MEADVLPAGRGHGEASTGSRRVVFLVPRRRDYDHRDRVWEYCRKRWERLFPDWPVIEGHHDDGAFNRSMAINRAAEEAGDWDVAIIIDSDVMLGKTQVSAAVEKAIETGLVTWAHTRWRGITESWTKRILDDREDFGEELSRDEMDLRVERTNPLSWSCCIAMPRDAFDALGGFDERFKGWGFEDMAFQSAVCGLLGWNRMAGDVIHLWHPRSEERIVPGQGRHTASLEYIVNARLGRRYMVALRRDYALHDRGDQPASEEERQRDIQNLIRDDAKYAPVAVRMGLPDWSQWWPTLPELIAGAKEARDATTSQATVSLIVRTGGAPETWPERSRYLRESLASLEQSVSGPVVQRVIYSDWGAEHAAELASIGEPFGFYVAGQGHHGYIGATQRLWKYIEKRAVGTYIFLAEDDFLYLKPFALQPMIDTLAKYDGIQQIALLREPAYAREMEGDGILGWPREEFEPKDQGNGHGRLEHRLFWTMNPSLFRKSITRFPWPNRESSERHFGDQLLTQPQTRFAFLGDGSPYLRHIGEVRAGGPY